MRSRFVSGLDPTSEPVRVGVFPDLTAGVGEAPDAWGGQATSRFRCWRRRRGRALPAEASPGADRCRGADGHRGRGDRCPGLRLRRRFPGVTLRRLGVGACGSEQNPS